MHVYRRNEYVDQLPPTPLVPVQLGSAQPLIWCKLEYLNPSGSTKDRIARRILLKAFSEGLVRPGDAVVEASSGSTSIAMALVCAQLDLKFTAVLPQGVSNERVLMIRAYGGNVHFAPPASGIHGCIAEAERLKHELGAFLPRQFSNPENAVAHQLGTAREVLDQIPGGLVNAVVSGVGTGGTLLGLMRGCRSERHGLKAFLARPVDLQGTPDAECCSFSSRIPGVLESASELFHESDHPDVETIEVRDREAIETTRELIKLGFPVGPSSGLNFRAVLVAAERLWPAKIVTIFPDRMERYFSTELFRPYRPEAAEAVAVPA